MPITVQHVIDALTLLGGRASIAEIHQKVIEIAPEPIPTSSRQVVRARLQNYCKESSQYRHRGHFFESVYELSDRRGVWKLALEEKTFDAGSEAEQSIANSSMDNRALSARNPKWSRDEIILALDLYMSNPASPPRKGSDEVAKLSALLNKLHRLTGQSGGPTLRNVNGIYLKMMNLRALDPTFLSDGKVGMKAGGALEKMIWREYEGKRDRLANDARIIRAMIEDADEAALAKIPESDAYEGEEGGVVLRLHKRYERDGRLVTAKRKDALRSGTLSCEACGFDFRLAYGEIGAGYIEVHHINPLSSMAPGRKTRLEDLALLCANCHRVAHRRRVPLTIAEIKECLEGADARGTP